MSPAEILARSSLEQKAESKRIGVKKKCYFLQRSETMLFCWKNIRLREFAATNIFARMKMDDAGKKANLICLRKKKKIFTL